MYICSPRSVGSIAAPVSEIDLENIVLCLLASMPNIQSISSLIITIYDVHVRT